MGSTAIGLGAREPGREGAGRGGRALCFFFFFPLLSLDLMGGKEGERQWLHESMAKGEKKKVGKNDKEAKERSCEGEKRDERKHEKG